MQLLIVNGLDMKRAAPLRNGSNYINKLTNYPNYGYTSAP